MVPSGKRISLTVVHPVVAISRRKAAINWRVLMTQDSVKQREKGQSISWARRKPTPVSRRSAKIPRRGLIFSFIAYEYVALCDMDPFAGLYYGNREKIKKADWRVGISQAPTPTQPRITSSNRPLSPGRAAYPHVRATIPK